MIRTESGSTAELIARGLRRRHRCRGLLPTGVGLAVLIAVGTAQAAELYGWVVPARTSVPLTLCRQQENSGKTETTDGHGYYHFRDIAPGRYNLHVGQRGCNGPPTPVYVEPGITRFDPKIPGR